MTSSEKYAKHMDEKKAWYEKHFSGRLIETFEGPTLSGDASKVIDEHFR